MSGATAMVLMPKHPPGSINSELPDSDNADPGQAEITFDNDGTYDYIEAGGAVSVNWVTPATAGIAAQYELQVNVNSGTLTSGTVDSWLALSSDRFYVKSGVGSCELRVRIREAGSTIVRTDQTVLMIVNP